MSRTNRIAVKKPSDGGDGSDDRWQLKTLGLVKEGSQNLKVDIWLDTQMGGLRLVRVLKYNYTFPWRELAELLGYFFSLPPVDILIFGI